MDEDLVVKINKDVLKRALTQHSLMGITCDHEKKTDTPQCACCSLQFDAFPSIGAAVDAWADHVIDVIWSDTSIGE